MKDSQVSIALEDLVNGLSSINYTKLDKELIYKQLANIDALKGDVIWEDDRITGFRLYDAMDSINISLELTTEGDIITHGY